MTASSDGVITMNISSLSIETSSFTFLAGPLGRYVTSAPDAAYMVHQPVKSLCSSAGAANSTAQAWPLNVACSPERHMCSDVIAALPIILPNASESSRKVSSHMQVDLGRVVAQQFQNTTASIVFFGALHNVRCLTRQVPLLGSAATKATLVQPKLNVQVHCPAHASVLLWFSETNSLYSDIQRKSSTNLSIERFTFPRRGLFSAGVSPAQ